MQNENAAQRLWFLYIKHVDVLLNTSCHLYDVILGTATSAVMINLDWKTLHLLRESKEEASEAA